MSQPAPPDGHEIEPGCRAICAKFRLDNKIIQDAGRRDAGGIGPDGGLAVRCLVSVIRGFISLLSRMKLSFPLCATIATFFTDMIDLLSGLGRKRSIALHPCCPLARPAQQVQGWLGRREITRPARPDFCGEGTRALQSARQIGKTIPADFGSAGTSPSPARGQIP
jgi:hypothetical protein